MIQLHEMKYELSTILASDWLKKQVLNFRRAKAAKLCKPRVDAALWPFRSTIFLWRHRGRVIIHHFKDDIRCMFFTRCLVKSREWDTWFQNIQLHVRDHRVLQSYENSWRLNVRHINSKCRSSPREFVSSTLVYTNIWGLNSVQNHMLQSCWATEYWNTSFNITIWPKDKHRED